jgi:hypothetical protein
MSDLRKVLDRAEADYGFYLSVLTDPAKALAPFQLTDSERKALTADRLSLWRLVSRVTLEPPPPPPQVLNGRRHA